MTYQTIPPGGGGRVLVGQLTVPADTAAVVFSGLSGESAGGFEFEGVMINNSVGQPTYTLQPNAITANQNSVRAQIGAGAVTVSQRTDLLLTIGNSTGGLPAYFKGTFTSRIGLQRFLLCRSCNIVGGNSVEEQVSGRWTDTTTVITSFTIASSLALGIGAGSKITVFSLGSPLL